MRWHELKIAINKEYTVFTQLKLKCKLKCIFSSNCTIFSFNKFEWLEIFLDLGHGSSLRVMVGPEARLVENHWSTLSNSHTVLDLVKILTVHIHNYKGLASDSHLNRTALWNGTHVRQMPCSMCHLYQQEYIMFVRPYWGRVETVPASTWDRVHNMALGNTAGSPDCNHNQ